MDDLISRQAAIDFINAGHLVNSNEPRWSDNEVVNFLKSRPSAQPYTDEEIQKMQELEQAELQKAYECGRASAQPEIIHCGDCRHWKNDHLCECLSRYGTFETEIYFYCGFAERRGE